MKGGDPKALRNFIIKLEGVHIRAIETGRENAFNSQDILANVLKKIEFLKTQWAHHNLKRKERWDPLDKQGPPDATFSDLLTFLNRQNQLALEKDAYEVPKQADGNENPKKSPNIAAAFITAPQRNRGNNRNNTPSTNICNANSNPQLNNKTNKPKFNNKQQNNRQNNNQQNNSQQNNNQQNNSQQNKQDKQNNNNRPRTRQQAPQQAPSSSVSSQQPSSGQDQSSSAQTAPKSASNPRPASTGWMCWVCRGTVYHRVDACVVFTSLSVDERCDLVRKLELCNLCLTKGHMARDCNRTWKCRECQGKHHTTIHWDDQADQASS